MGHSVALKSKPKQGTIASMLKSVTMEPLLMLRMPAWAESSIPRRGTARLCCIALIVLWAAVAVKPGQALAHDWYPLECCADKDCAPADTVVRREDGSYLVTSRGMSVAIPGNYGNWRQAPDGRLHVCLRRLRSGAVYLICAFRGPGV